MVVVRNLASWHTIRDVTNNIIKLIPVHLMQKPVYRQRAMRLLLIRDLDQRDTQHAQQTGPSAERKRQWEVAEIAQNASQYGKRNSASPVTEKNQRIVLTNTFTAEGIRRYCREERKVATEIEPDQCSPQVQ